MGFGWDFLDMSASQSGGRHEESFPASPPKIIKTLGQVSRTWRNRQLGKINLASCSMRSNGILILLQGKGGRGLWWAAVCRLHTGTDRERRVKAAPRGKRAQGSKGSRETDGH